MRAGVDTDRAKIEKTVKTILSEIKKMRAKGVSEKELQKAKDNLRGKMALSLESSDEVASYLGRAGARAAGNKNTGRNSCQD